ncbi:GYF domain-containing protein [Gemmatimonas sp.]|uniref:GYF domain-containing protein n=1 Tax=Gemmatimonas sp. TaxID=1962908 RepID=UPI0037BEE1A6
MSMSLWHFVQDGQKAGPVNRDEIAASYADGRIADDTLVWTPGMSQWRPLSEVHELRAFLESLRIVPPPIPPSQGHEDSSAQTHASAGSDNRERSATSAERWTEAISPWRRWYARILDLSLFAIVGSLMVPSDLWPENNFVTGLLIAVAWMPLETIMVAARGRTPGKALLGLRVTHFVPGARLTVGQSATRAWLAFVSGQGLGIPFVALFTQIYQHQRIARGEPVSYDEGRSRVYGEPLSPLRWLASIALGAGILMLMSSDIRK